MARRTKTRTASSAAVEVSESNKHALEAISDAVISVDDVIVIEVLIDRQSTFASAVVVVNETIKYDIEYEQFAALLREVPDFDTYEMREVKPWWSIFDER